MSKETIVKTGPSTTGILGVVFIVLKLTHVIDWSWIWVLAPFWIPICLLFIILLIFGGIYILALFNKYQ
jgi:hypothetical protein